jgi:hypothetical protein
LKHLQPLVQFIVGAEAVALRRTKMMIEGMGETGQFERSPLLRLASSGE